MKIAGQVNARETIWCFAAGILATVLLALSVAGCNVGSPTGTANIRIASPAPSVAGLEAGAGVDAAAAGGDAHDSAQAQNALETPTRDTSAPGAGQTGSATDAVVTSGQSEGLVATHRVVAGDTLTRIAQKYGVSVASLQQANELANPDFLEVGQIITLPVPPVDYTPSSLILPDSRLVRSVRAAEFDIDRFLASRGGALSRLTAVVTRRNPNGSIGSDSFPASEVIKRVSLEYSVDARILIAFLERFAGLVSQASVDVETTLYPLLPPNETSLVDRTGLYAQLSWLADRLNQGYYSWKYRGVTTLELVDGSRLLYAPELNAGTIAVQYALAQMPTADDWKAESDKAGLLRTYIELFGDPFAGSYETVPRSLQQPKLTLPFPRGETWRFTGGFHGGWGNGSAWAAIDFSPPPEAQPIGHCATSSFPATAVARGAIARLDEGLVILDLDLDSVEETGWTILYLHVDYHDSLAVGQIVEAGNIIGYPSCLGGFTTATHLHIARRFNGEWIPADCNRCPSGVASPPFVMSNWRVVGLESQLYQGFMVNQLDNRSAVAEQGRYTSINEITW